MAPDRCGPPTKKSEQATKTRKPVLIITILNGKKMAQGKIGKDKGANEAGLCGELVTTLQRLFLLMRERSISFEFMNLMHKTMYEGKHVPYLLEPAKLAGVKAEKGRVLIQSDDAIFRIYQDSKTSILETLQTLLEWAKERIERLTQDIDNKVRLISAPRSVNFYSAAR